MIKRREKPIHRIVLSRIRKKIMVLGRMWYKK
jgi:hypothetical protein